MGFLNNNNFCMKRTVYTISAYCFLVLPFLTATSTLAQGVGIGTATPDASAQVQVNPSKIVLSWPQDTVAVPVSYTVFRKPPGATKWG